MAVYIDEMVNYKKVIGRAGPEWCHLVADSTQEILEFAERLHLQLRWIQNAGTALEHFDIGTHEKRQLAVRFGAIEITRREMGHRFKTKVEEKAALLASLPVTDPALLPEEKGGI